MTLATFNLFITSHPTMNNTLQFSSVSLTR